MGRDDFQIVNPLEHIREHPEIYLEDGANVTGSSLMCRLLADVLVNNNCQVVIQRLESWWIIGSDVDWAGTAQNQVFYTIVPFPQAGQNCFHAEVLLTVFARDVVVFSGNSHTVIVGATSVSEEILNFRRNLPFLNRMIGFRMKNEE
ncbi:hypothetical protein [Lignipirellula cremea]|uniref:Uncharacterized protein n=1 Tax=Lignipirellula cremea TaxID=2528010 RepID=A0A518DNF5_9BACT|nr:hypothetical protein [Lignipirellula cremea]QDU93361.1 hypothetical protein Pla8534_11410 [Lignipirellula cremea]